MKVLIVFAAILALATAQWAPNTAQQVSNANAGLDGTAIASGTANAFQTQAGSPYGYGYGQNPYYGSPNWGYPNWGGYGGGYSPNLASQVSNANAGEGGSAIASGTANANRLREKRSADPQAGGAYWGYPGYSYPGYGYDGYSPNVASQVSNANAGLGGTAIASGTANANQRPGLGRPYRAVRVKKPWTSSSVSSGPA